MINFFKKEIVLVFLIFFLALGIRIFITFTSDNFHGIAAGKTIIAQNILKNPNPVDNYDPVHGLFHLYLLAGALYIWNNPLLAPRMVSLVSGSLMIFFFYYFIRRLFDRETAFFSSLLLSFYPLHVIYSTLSVAVVPYNFFIFAALFCFFLFKEKKKLFYLIFSAFLVGCASNCRYEGGLFIPLLTILLFNEKKREMLAFFSIAMILPTFLMWLSYYRFGHPLVFYYTNSSHVQALFNIAREHGAKYDFWGKLMIWPSILKEYLPAFVVGVGFIGSLYSLSNKKYRNLAIIFLVLLSVIVYETVSERLHWDERYSIYSGILLILFCIVVIKRIISVVNPSWSKIVLTIFAVWFIYTSFPIIMDRRRVAPSFVKEVASFLAIHVKDDAKVYVDYTISSNSMELDPYLDTIQAYSGLDNKHFLHVPRKIVDNSELVVDESHFQQILKEEKPSFLVFSPSKGYLSEVLNISPADHLIENRYGLEFDFIKEIGIYRIYSLSFKEEAI